MNELDFAAGIAGGLIGYILGSFLSRIINGFTRGSFYRCGLRAGIALRKRILKNEKN